VSQLYVKGCIVVLLGLEHAPMHRLLLSELTVDAGTEVAARQLGHGDSCVATALLTYSNPSSNRISWLLVPISLASTLKSSLLPLASPVPTPGPDSTPSPPVMTQSPLSNLTPQRGLEIHWSLLALQQIQGLFPRSRYRYCRLCWLPGLRGRLPQRRPRPSRRRCPLRRPLVIAA
jgi:hypothetical protein